jgi:hypothetical protein
MAIDPRLAKDLAEQKLPNVFLGEFQEFNWGFEPCILANGRQGIRFIFFPALLPFIKFSLPFVPAGLQALRDDISIALEKYGDESVTPTEV